MTPHMQLQQTPPKPDSHPDPASVISWDPSRPWRGPAHSLARLAVGPASSVTWGVGLGQPASSSVDGQTSGPTLKAHQVFCHPAPIGPERFDLPPTPFANANIGEINVK